MKNDNETETVYRKILVSAKFGIVYSRQFGLTQQPHCKNKRNETQDKLPLRFRKWAAPKGIFLAELCSKHKLETPSFSPRRIILCSMCFSTSANFLQRTMHVMSGMLNKDKSSRTLNFLLSKKNFSLTSLAFKTFCSFKLILLSLSTQT